MRANWVIRALSLVALASLTALMAEDRNAPAQPRYSYDVANQQTIEGNVVEIRDYSCPVSGSLGSHMTVKSNSGEIEVHLAPASFMKQYEIVIHKGDKVTVVGSRIIYEGKPALIARTVSAGNDNFTFRDDKGRPLW